MKQPKSVTDWMKCVADAKKIHKQETKAYVVTRGTILKTAQKLYCLKGY